MLNVYSTFVRKYKMTKHKLTVNYSDGTIEMGHSARLRFTLLHLADLHFLVQCIKVNSPKFNNISYNQ